MNIEKIAGELIITKKINNCYLLYTTKEYYLFKPENDSYSTIKINLSENPSKVEDSFTYSEDLDKLSNDSTINSELRFIMVHLEFLGLNEEIRLNTIHAMFYELAEINYYVESDDEYNDKFDRNKRFKDIDNENIINSIEVISNEVKRNKSESAISELYNAFKNRTGVKKAQRDLGNYLNTECGIILRKNSHELYKLDVANKGYDSITIDEIIAELTGIFGENNLFSTNDVETAVDFISERLTPDYDVVKFSNGLYSMKEHQLINPTDPVFTLIESPFNYNPDAKPVDIKYSDKADPVNIEKFLNTAFERNTPEETNTEIKGVLQVIGYLFTSGNVYNVLIFLVGIGGAGKGTLATIIAEIFKGKTTQLDFSKIEKDTHATSILIGKHLNIVRETRTGIVDENTTYKLLSGNDSIPINPKNQTPYELPAQEVPKSLMNANNLPNFRNPEISLLQRFIVVEFKRIFRNTDDDVRNLAELICNSDENMEWLIYHSLEAYKEMVLNGEDFILRLDETKTLELLYKHSKPLNYLIRMLIAKHDPVAFETEVEISSDDSANGVTEFTTPYIVADELKELIVYLSKIEGVQIPYDKKNGKVSSRKLLTAIKDEFDLFDYQLEKANGGTMKYTTINKRVNGRQQRVYPELIKTDEYDDYLMEMKENDVETQQNKNNSGD